MLARAFLRKPKVVLIDEPTQGVDANARFDIYRAVRAMMDGGASCIINSSDAMELAGICDRVLVFSRGRVIRELQRADISEESIVSAFLRSTEVGRVRTQRLMKHTAHCLRCCAAWPPAVAASGGWPSAFLTLLMLVMVTYAATNTDVFLTKLNIRHILLATAPLALVTMAQFNVLMVRGFDISVGSLMSLTVVLASFLIGAEAAASEIVTGVALCLMAGIVVGGINGALVRGLGVNPVITTIATLSVLQGIALFLRPSPGGAINADFMDLLAVQVSGIPLSFYVILAAAIGGDLWLYGTRGGLKMRAVGFREQAARRNGVHIEFVHMRAYLDVQPAGSGRRVFSVVGGGRRSSGHRTGLHANQHRGRRAGRSSTERRSRLIRRGDVRRAVLHHHDQRYHVARPQHRCRHHHQRRADPFRGVPVFRLAAPRTSADTSPRPLRTRRHGRQAGERVLSAARTAVGSHRAADRPRGRGVQMRFAAIWFAMLALVGVCAIIVPRSLMPSTFLATVPLAAFLAIAATGETLVLMSRGIDLSTPAVIALSSTLILGVSQGHDGNVWLAVAAALSSAAAIGLLNGLLVAWYAAQRVDCHPRGRRNHQRRHAVVSQISSGGIARAASDGGLGRLAICWAERFGVGRNDPGDRADPRAAQDHHRPPLRRGRSQSARGLGRWHQRRPPIRPRHSPSRHCFMALPGSCCRHSFAIPP